MKIEKAINQKAFKNPHQKAHINVLYTASWLSQQNAKVLKPFQISWQQFNILRILRGMAPQPATVKLLTERMIDKTSNASRLVEKLKKKGLVERVNCEKDRRRVNVSITQEGLNLLDRASAAVDASLAELAASIGSEEAEMLNDLLDKMRG
jgi:DNA-binding MarR family transcriptional regulator